MAEVVRKATGRTRSSNGFEKSISSNDFKSRLSEKSISSNDSEDRLLEKSRSQIDSEEHPFGLPLIIDMESQIHSKGGFLIKVL